MSRLIRLPRGALAKLREADPALKGVFKKVGPFRLEVGFSENALEALSRAIIYQQLSGKAASTIYRRFRALFDSETFPSPEAILSCQNETLRSAGLSRQKLSYLQDLCTHLSKKTLLLESKSLQKLSDEDVIQKLTKVRGIGRWSAQMFLISHLGRLNIWPEDDLGIRKAVQAIHKYKELPKTKMMITIGKRYQPYCTIASWYLWRFIDL